MRLSSRVGRFPPFAFGKSFRDFGRVDAVTSRVDEEGGSTPPVSAGHLDSRDYLVSGALKGCRQVAQVLAIALVTQVLGGLGEFMGALAIGGCAPDGENWAIAVFSAGRISNTPARLDCPQIISHQRPRLGQCGLFKMTPQAAPRAFSVC